MADLTDLDLLRIEIDTIWELDARRRLVHARRADLRAVPYVVVVASSGGDALFIDARVPDEMAAQIEAAHASAGRAARPNEQPPSFAPCIGLLEPKFGAVDVAPGVGYAVPDGVAFDAGALIRRSTDADAAALIDAAPTEANWAPDEWRELVEGRLGPWAMALVDGRVVSICHCARLAPQGAEAGTWTHPEHRGRGHAAAATAAWAALLADSGKHLFYSTSADNISSQRVASRLGLRRLGWIWQIGPRPTGAG